MTTHARYSVLFGVSLSMLVFFGSVAATLADGPPGEPWLLYYDLDFNNNGQRDDGDLSLLCQYFIDFRQRGHLTQITNRANVYHDTVLDRRDIELLIDDWLNPKKHPFLTPGPWPPSSSQSLAPSAGLAQFSVDVSLSGMSQRTLLLRSTTLAISSAVPPTVLDQRPSIKRSLKVVDRKDSAS